MFNLTLELLNPGVEVGETFEVKGNLTLMGLGMPGLIKVTAGENQTTVFTRPPSGEYRAGFLAIASPVAVKAEHLSLPPFKVESPTLKIKALAGAASGVIETIPWVIPSERITMYREIIREKVTPQVVPYPVPYPVVTPTPTPQLPEFGIEVEGEEKPEVEMGGIEIGIREVD